MANFYYNIFLRTYNFNHIHSPLFSFVPSHFPSLFPTSLSSTFHPFLSSPALMNQWVPSVLFIGAHMRGALWTWVFPRLRHWRKCPPRNCVTLGQGWPPNPLLFRHFKSSVFNSLEEQKPSTEPLFKTWFFTFTDFAYFDGNNPV